MATNKVRIISGEWRSRLLRFPDQPGLRPTSDRVRETLFNWLHPLEGKTCLDLFAGSGALGFEAASRGAKQVTLIERNPKVIAALRENALALEAQRVKIICADGATWLAKQAGVYDVIFLDPPFQAGLLNQLLPTLSAHLQPEGYAYVESDVALDAPEGMHWHKTSRAGAVHFGLLTRNENV